MTILAYVTKQSLAAEYEVAKKCLEIMDETTTRLSFEFEARLRIILFGMLLLICFSGILYGAVRAFLAIWLTMYAYPVYFYVTMSANDHVFNSSKKDSKMN